MGDSEQLPLVQTIWKVVYTTRLGLFVELFDDEDEARASVRYNRRQGRLRWFGECQAVWVPTDWTKDEA